MLIYVFISSHGYGHAARQAAVLTEIHRLRPDWRLVLSTAVDRDFLDVLMQDIPFEHRNLRWDVGMVQSNALDADFDATLCAINHLNKQLPSQIKTEANWIKKQNLPVIILADIPPAAAEVAHLIDAPLVWMGNFGWDDIYCSLGGDFTYHGDLASAQYARGQLLIRCPFSLSMSWDLNEKSVGLTASQPLPLPDGFKSHINSIDVPIVLVGFGGLGFPIQPHLFNLWPDNFFLIPTPPSSQIALSYKDVHNLTFLPPRVRIVDVLPHCSRHLGKPGYSSFCECISQSVGLHVVERFNFAEVDVLTDGLKRYGSHIFLSQEAFENGDWELNSPLLQPLYPFISTDGALVAALEIVGMEN